MDYTAFMPYNPPCRRFMRHRAAYLLFGVNRGVRYDYTMALWHYRTTPLPHYFFFLGFSSK